MEQLRNIAVYKIVLGVILLCFTTSVFGQNKNPFELKHRLKKETVTSIENSEVEEKPTTSSSNPFEVKHRNEKPTPVIPDNDTPNNEVSNNNPFEIDSPKEQVEEVPKPESKTEEIAPRKVGKPLSSGNLTFWVIIGMMILYTLGFSMFKPFVTKVYRSFTNENFLKLVHREQQGVLQFPYIFLYFIFSINMGVFTYLSCRYFGFIRQDSWSTLFLLIGAIGGMFFLKHLILFLLGSIFPVGKESKQYSFTITIFSIMIGLFLAPMNTLIAYAPENMTKLIIYGTLVIIGLAYIFRYFRSLFLGSRYITMHKFHFFMYLCTVEIAPVFVLLKIIMLTAGIQ